MLWNVLNTKLFVGIPQWYTKTHLKLDAFFGPYQGIRIHSIFLCRFKNFLVYTCFIRVKCYCPFNLSGFILASMTLCLFNFSNILSFPDDGVDHMLLHENIKFLFSKELVPLGVEVGSKFHFFFSVCAGTAEIHFCDVTVTGQWSSPSGYGVPRCGHAVWWQGWYFAW